MSLFGPALPTDRGRREKLLADAADRIARSGLAGWDTAVRTAKTAGAIRGPRRLLRFLRAGGAVSAIEYAILVGIVVLGLAAALNAFQNEIAQALSSVSALFASTPGLTP